MRKKAKMRLFKNDPFGIKFKIFDMRLRKCLKEEVVFRGKAIATYLNIVNIIGIPRDDEEKEVLRKAVEEYDKMIQEIDNTTLRYARLYLAVEEDEGEEECESQE